MGSVLVIEFFVLSHGSAKAFHAKEGRSTNALTFDRSYPPFCVGIQIWTCSWKGQRFHVSIFQNRLPALAVFGIPIMDQVLGTDLLQPANVFHGIVASSLFHERFVWVLSHADDMNPPSCQVNEEQDIDRSLSKPAPDISREEVSRDNLMVVTSNEWLPVGLAHAPLWIGRLHAVTFPDRAYGPGTDDDLQILELTNDAHGTPTRVLPRHPQNQHLGLIGDSRTTGFGELEAQGPLLEQTVPVLDRSHANHGTDLAQSSPADGGAGLSEPSPPGHTEREPLGWKLLPIKGVLGPQVGNLCQQDLVLLLEHHGGDEPQHQWKMVHWNSPQWIMRPLVGQAALRVIAKNQTAGPNRAQGRSGARQGHKATPRGNSTALDGIRRVPLSFRERLRTPANAL